jgi:gliding motility-associated-like protein
MSNSSSLQHPVHTYGTAGTFAVSLTVTTIAGCTETFTQNVIVHPLPAPGYTANPTCVNALTTFNNSSTISSGMITSYSWNFGDPSSGSGNISTLENPTHIFTNSGNYTIILTATSNFGCATTTSQNLTITGAPNAAFSATSVCQNYATVFTDTSSVSGSSINSWTWNFGDSLPISTNQNPTHTYTSSGTYDVVLSVTSSNGCQDKDTATVTVYSLPVVSFSAPPVCIQNSTVFTDQTTIASGTLTTWAWNFGNFTPLYYGENPNYMYSSAGAFNVSLTVTTSNGCIGSYSDTVNVYTIPVANFSSNNACLNSATEFTDNSLVIGGSIASWVWGFGDGSPIGTTQNPSHVYTSPGTYNTSLVVTSIHGCIDTVTKPSTVFPLPVVKFIVDDSSGCATYCTQFNEASTPLSGNFTNWLWDFGDNSFQSTLQNPEHCYSESGLYTITLTATTSNGCSATAYEADLINVYPVPQSDFAFNPSPASTLNSEVSFTDLSSGASGWMWDFGDSSDTAMSYLSNPLHNYYNAGNYCIMQVVQNIYHCVDTSIRCIQVEPEFSFFIPNAFTPAASPGTNDGFGGKGTNISQYDLWIFDRWGNMIFHTSDLTEKWDGRANGGKDVAQQDVYIYQVELFDFRGYLHKYRGTVTLVR